MSTIESWLREILRCPACRSTLRDVTGSGGEPELACTGCSLAYRIDDGIPVLLVDEARDRDADGGSGSGSGPATGTTGTTGSAGTGPATGSAGTAGTGPATGSAGSAGSAPGHGAAPDQSGL